ncbi:MAG: hypothetical protein GKS00_06190 [Alphaproteobacteria bacterium]|nr:hypothetical protein [Alphaproteobacteria bacterium]
MDRQTKSDLERKPEGIEDPADGKRQEEAARTKRIASEANMEEDAVSPKEVESTDDTARWTEREYEMAQPRGVEGAGR